MSAVVGGEASPSTDIDPISVPPKFGMMDRPTIEVIIKEGEDTGMCITLVPKVLFKKNVFLFVGLTTFGTSANFDWLFH